MVNWDYVENLIYFKYIVAQNRPGYINEKEQRFRHNSHFAADTGYSNFSGKMHGQNLVGYVITPRKYISLPGKKSQT
jgi:hypothetical protein